MAPILSRPQCVKTKQGKRNWAHWLQRLCLQNFLLLSIYGSLRLNMARFDKIQDAGVFKNTAFEINGR